MSKHLFVLLWPFVIYSDYMASIFEAGKAIIIFSGAYNTIHCGLHNMRTFFDRTCSKMTILSRSSCQDVCNQFEHFSRSHIKHTFFQNYLSYFRVSAVSCLKKYVLYVAFKKYIPDIWKIWKKGILSSFNTLKRFLNKLKEFTPLQIFNPLKSQRDTIHPRIIDQFKYLKMAKNEWMTVKCYGNENQE